MLAYFDTSALVPLVITEASTPLCNEQWDRADPLVASSLAYVEVHAALAQAVRTGRLGSNGHARALEAFEVRWDDVVHVPPSDSIIKLAARVASSHPLRGYDAVHCATALAAASDDFVAVSGDRDLLQAWSALGIATIDTGR